MNNKLNRVKELLKPVALSLLLLSCSENDEIQELTFIGDSHVERWDLAASFPSYICHNYGLSRSGLDYLLTLQPKAEGRNVVVVTGRNDIQMINEETIQAYAERYVQTLAALSAKRLFVYCIFPCTMEQTGGNEGDAKRVRQLNEWIKREIEQQGVEAVYIDVYDDLLYRGELNQQYSADGLHLNAFGYQILTNKLLKVL